LVAARRWPGCRGPGWLDCRRARRVGRFACRRSARNNGLAGARHGVQRAARRLERRMNPQPLKRWLVASLILNLFLIGGIAGGTWRWWTAERERAAVPSTAAQPRG